MRGRWRGLGHDVVVVARRDHERRVVAVRVPREADDLALAVARGEDVAEVGEHLLADLADRDDSDVRLGEHQLVRVDLLGRVAPFGLLVALLVAALQGVDGPLIARFVGQVDRTVLVVVAEESGDREADAAESRTQRFSIFAFRLALGLVGARDDQDLLHPLTPRVCPAVELFPVCRAC